MIPEILIPDTNLPLCALPENYDWRFFFDAQHVPPFRFNVDAASDYPSAARLANERILVHPSERLGQIRSTPEEILVCCDYRWEQRPRTAGCFQ